MGWLFGKKKPRIPLPEGHLIDERALQFPDFPKKEFVPRKEVKPDFKMPKDFDFPFQELPIEKPKIDQKFPQPKLLKLGSKKEKIKPEKIKEALEFEDKLHFPPPKKVAKKPILREPKPEQVEIPIAGALYIKMEVYQQLLEATEEANDGLKKLQETNRKLETSEYNEENYFEKLKKQVKILHDDFMQIDKLIFSEK